MARRYIKRKSAIKVDKITGSIVDTINVDDKTSNTYSANVIDELIKSAGNASVSDNYNYSVEATDGGTIDDLAAFTAGKPGMTGSISLTKKTSGVGSEIPAGWYNYFFSPHRSGVQDSAATDNANYGTIILMPMTFSGDSWILRRTSSATAITEVKKISTGLTISSLVSVQHTCMSSTQISPSGSVSNTVNFYNAGYYPIGLAGYHLSNDELFLKTIAITAASQGSVSVAYEISNTDEGANRTGILYCWILWAK